MKLVSKANKSIENSNIKYILTSTIFLFLFVLLSLLKDINGLFFMTMLSFNVLMILSLKNYKQNISLIMFLLCYFMFLLGSYFLYEYFGFTRGVVLFEPKIQNHIYLSLLISLLAIMIGYYFINIKFKKKNKYKNRINENVIMKCSLALFYLSYIPNTLIEILRVLKVREFGYTDLYIDEAIRVPYMLGLFAYGCIFYFYIYLSTMPNKRESKFPSFLYIMYSILTLFTGNRSVFVVNLSILFIYSIFRSRNINDEDNWISKRTLILVLCLIPILLILLDYLGSIRFSNTIFDENQSSSMLDIFVKQGVSSSVIGYEKMYDYRIPDKLYSFGTIIEKIKYNPISRLIFDIESIRGNSIERAMTGNSFAHAISYIVLPFGYLHGRGLGTSYIAETYHDFGYIGIFIFSLIYGFILKKCSNFSSSSFVKRVMIIIVLGSLLMIPRTNADSVISVFISNEFIFGIILIKLLTMFYTKYEKNRKA